MKERSPVVFIVDDDEAVRSSLRLLLKSVGLVPSALGSAREFLAALPEGLPRCLIVDLQMPEMGGLDLLQHLTRNGIRIPTIVITAHNEVGVRERCQSAGAAAFLSKPLQDTSLFAAIADASARDERMHSGAI